jgi:hypothetical protein
MTQAQMAPVKQVPAPKTAGEVPGPVSGTRMTEAYVRMVGRDAYFWGWPMVNLYNRRLTYAKVPTIGIAGPVVAAPLNQLGMLTDYIVPEERVVACPNQDVVYGIGALALDQSPVVVQVPDFGSRFWVYQIVDLRTDSFAELGKMYGTKPGFYLLVGPGWAGAVPGGITEVFRSSTNTGVVIPRVFQDDTAEDKKAVQAPVSQIMMYPLADFDGKMKSKDWSKLPVFPSTSQGDEEIKWVKPEAFFDVLPAVLNDAPPLPGEEALYAQIRSVLDAAVKDPKIKEPLTQVAVETEKEVVTPLFQFRSYGIPLPYQWTTQRNGARWGTDYFTRTAVAKSNIFVNQPQESTYFYQDLDANGARLNGANGYTVTFAKGALPPVKGFWSLTLYNQHHFFEPNDLKCYSLGTKNKTLQYNPDGSLTLYAGAKSPGKDEESNWLPAPNAPFSLFMRSYWPEKAILDGTWTPPAVEKVK